MKTTKIRITERRRPRAAFHDEEEFFTVSISAKDVADNGDVVDAVRDLIGALDDAFEMLEEARELREVRMEDIRAIKEGTDPE